MLKEAISAFSRDARSAERSAGARGSGVETAAFPRRLEADLNDSNRRELTVYFS
jgi:hypothetical protein